MEYLRHRDSKQVLNLLADLYALRNHDGFVHHVLHRLSVLIASDRTSFNEMDMKKGEVRAIWEPADLALQEAHMPAFRQYMHQHPTASYINKSGDARAVKISDFASNAQWLRTALYNEYFRRIGTKCQLAVMLAVPSSVLLPIAFNRHDRDFSERDRLLLNLLRPHLVQAFANAQALTQVQRELETLNGVVEQLDRGIIEVTAKGTIAWATTRARQLLSLYWRETARRQDRLPEVLLRWMRKKAADVEQVSFQNEPLVMRRDGHQLLIRFVPRPGKSLLFFEERAEELSSAPLRRAGLTSREADVLNWVAKGKTNNEIGLILKISPRTVQHYLERIFDKLGVETRTAAATRALELVREGRS